MSVTSEREREKKTYSERNIFSLTVKIQSLSAPGNSVISNMDALILNLPHGYEHVEQDPSCATTWNKTSRPAHSPSDAAAAVLITPVYVFMSVHFFIHGLSSFSEGNGISGGPRSNLDRLINRLV